MVLKKNRLLMAMTACMVLGLTACGGSNDSSSSDSGGVAGLVGSGTAGGEDSGTGTTTTGSATVNPAHTIVLTYPITDAIENLGGGVYRRRASAVVTDNEGNPVPDGTKVFLNVVDTIIAQGTITSENGDGISGSVLTDAGPTLGDGTTATTFDTAYAIRNEAYHFIHEGDHAFLTQYVDPDDSSDNFEPSLKPNSFVEDKNRIIDSFTANTLTVTSAYDNAYPNSTYASGVTDYIVGVSALGAEVLGVTSAPDTSSSTSTDAGEEGESSGSESTGDTLVNEGFATTVNGVAEFKITYPANVDTIHTGCMNPNLDERVSPIRSAQVFVVASAGTEATTIDQRFCFSSIAPWAMSAAPSKLGEGMNTVSLGLNDGGDGISLPYVWIGGFAVVNEGNITVNFTNSDGNPAGSFLTERYGSTTVGVEIIDNSNLQDGNGGAGGSVSIEFYSGGASAIYEVAIEDTRVAP